MVSVKRPLRASHRPAARHAPALCRKAALGRDAPPRGARFQQQSTARKAAPGSAKPTKLAQTAPRRPPPKPKRKRADSDSEWEAESDGSSSSSSSDNDAASSCEAGSPPRSTSATKPPRRAPCARKRARVRKPLAAAPKQVPSATTTLTGVRFPRPCHAPEVRRVLAQACHHAETRRALGGEVAVLVHREALRTGNHNLFFVLLLEKLELAGAFVAGGHEGTAGQRVAWWGSAACACAASTVGAVDLTGAASCLAPTPCVQRKRVLTGTWLSQQPLKRSYMPCGTCCWK